MTRGTLLLACLLVAPWGCAAGSTIGDADDLDDGGGTDGGAGGRGGAIGGGGAGGGMGGFAPAGGGTPGEPGTVWANDYWTLYKLDTDTLTLSTVGSFDCLGGSEMFDIATDKDGNLYGVAGPYPSYLIDIDEDTASCTKIGETGFNYTPTGLTFLPSGTLDPTEETLIALQTNPALAGPGAQYARIDRTTGTGSLVASFGWYVGTAEDIVSIIGDHTYAVGHAPSEAEGQAQHLLIVDATTGAVLEDRGILPVGFGPVGYEQIAGFGYWGGTLYGFTDAGKLLAIDPVTLALTEIPITGAPPYFTGAAVTTSAPIDPPN